MQVSTATKIKFDEEAIKDLVLEAVRARFPTMNIDEFNFLIKRSPQRVEIEIEGSEGDEKPEPKQSKAEVVEKKNSRLAAALEPKSKAEPTSDDDDDEHGDVRDDSPIIGGDDVGKSNLDMMKEVDDEVTAEEEQTEEVPRKKKTLGSLFTETE